MAPEYTRTTPILDYDHPAIEALVTDRGWRDLPPHERIGRVYDFVRNEIGFGYNSTDELSASQVLSDGYGQCNTKTSLLMALLRASGVPCRFHGATIHKRLQRGVVSGIFYRLAPNDIIHSWAEAQVDGRWVELEGVILDEEYLNGLRRSVATSGEFLGYGVGTEDMSNPNVVWRGTDTAIQKTGVNRDWGVWADPDDFYRQRGANLSGIKALIYSRLVRHVMNRKVAAIRGGEAGA